MDDVKAYPPYLDYPKPRKPTTNADKIRAMSDGELADFFRMLCHWIEDCADCPLYHEGCPVSGTLYEWIKWLQQPAEGEGHETDM